MLGSVISSAGLFQAYKSTNLRNTSREGCYTTLPLFSKHLTMWSTLCKWQFPFKCAEKVALLALVIHLSFLRTRKCTVFTTENSGLCLRVLRIQHSFLNPGRLVLGSGWLWNSSRIKTAECKPRPRGIPGVWCCQTGKLISKSIHFEDPISFWSTSLSF